MCVCVCVCVCVCLIVIFHLYNDNLFMGYLNFEPLVIPNSRAQLLYQSILTTGVCSIRVVDCYLVNE